MTMITIYLWWLCFCFDFASVQHVVSLCLQWPQTQLLPAVCESSTGQMIMVAVYLWWLCFCFDLALVQHVASLCLQWLLTQLFPAVWESSTCQQRYLYLWWLWSQSSLMTMFLFWFCFGTTCGAIIFAVATDITILCSLGRQYMPALFVSLMIMVTVFFNDNVFVLILLRYSMWRHYVCSGYWHNYFMQSGKAVQASTLCIFDDYGHSLL